MSTNVASVRRPRNPLSLEYIEGKKAYDNRIKTLDDINPGTCNIVIKNTARAIGCPLRREADYEFTIHDIIMHGRSSLED